MRHARDPSSKLCHACGERFVGYGPDHCPACGGFGWGPSNDRIPADELELANAIACACHDAYAPPLVPVVVDMLAFHAADALRRRR